MTQTDPPKMPNGTRNVPESDEISPYGGASPTALDNIAKGVDPSPKEAEHIASNPAEPAGYGNG